jgi:hypothetical protein
LPLFEGFSEKNQGFRLKLKDNKVDGIIVDIQWHIPYIPSIKKLVHTEEPARHCLAKERIRAIRISKRIK